MSLRPLFILFYLILIGCGPASYTISIKVEDERTKEKITELKDVKYKPNDEIINSNLDISTGYLNSFDIKSNQLPLTITVPEQLGYFGLEKNIPGNIDDGEEIIISLIKKETTIYGVVYDASDTKDFERVIANCYIETDPRTMETHTDSEGYFEIHSPTIREDIPYTIYFEKLGFKPNPKTKYYPDLFKRNKIEWKLEPKIPIECWVCDFDGNEFESQTAKIDCEKECLKKGGECDVCTSELPPDDFRGN